MRLLDTWTGHFVEKDPEETEYAILSHTWDNLKGEQTYKQLKKIQQRYETQPSAPQSQPRLSDPDDSTGLVTEHRDEPGRSRPSILRLSGSRLSHRSSATASVRRPLALKPVMPTQSLVPRLFKQAYRRIRKSLKRGGTRASRSFINNSGASHSGGALASSLSEVQFFLAFVLPSLWHFIQSTFNNLLSKLYSFMSRFSSAQTGIPDSIIPTSPLSPSRSLPGPIDTSVEGQSPVISPSPIWDDPELSPKIRDACAVARANGFRYIWIDSCCIDKSSSSELSEVINSMYSWYARAAICYAYLADVPANGDHWKHRSRFRESRWFLRGWTLQELIAPLHVEFLAEDWTVIGSKHALVDLIQSVTKIEYKALLHLEPLDKFSVAQRLSWAAERKTTRVEDQAYSLLGIFDINMPTLYGEGEGAFRRLQEEIMRRIPDQSLFAWGRVSPGSHVLPVPDTVAMEQDSCNVQCIPYPESDSLLAVYPRNFENSGTICAIRHDTPAQTSQVQPSHRHEIEYTSSPYGIRTKFRMIPLSRYFASGSIQSESPEKEWFLAILECEHTDHPGHLLGRVCYISPSPSGVDFLYPGYLLNSSFRGRGHRQLDFLSLSAEAVERCRPHTQLKTVHISHPGRAAVYYPTARYRPHKAIDLVLLKETSDALLARGYTADLRAGLPGLSSARNPTGTHQLTLSSRGRGHTIAVEFRHTIWDGGERFTIDATVKTSRLRSTLVDVAARARPWSFYGAVLRSDTDTAGSTRTTVSWSHASPWSGLGHKRVTLNPARGQSVAVDLWLDFAGMGVYFLRVDVVADALAVSLPRGTERRVSVSGIEADVGEPGDDESGGRGIRASWRQMAFWRLGRRGGWQGRSVVGGAAGDGASGPQAVGRNAVVGAEPTPRAGEPGQWW
ncbi:hypothetical protein GSI_08794 [Ganoderma sinense ZZ0214-1]|uniref:Uncharacterized protein n=1 Tax=Ganoderma sinense ZZ0214-1 TaxID=1077348 RepID=A0A2G8S4Q0_9APHY|nr:hypothetical protein GSI_08794 [Ganoderma sinense ZZ0214-1]